MKYRVTHTTRYVYEARVGHCYNEARLLPRELPHQQVRTAGLTIDPVPEDRRQRVDYFGNQATYFSILTPHDTLVVTASSEVEVVPVPPPDPLFASQSWEAVIEHLRQDLSDENLDAFQYCLNSPSIKIDGRLRAYALPSFSSGRVLIEAVEDLMGRIFKEFTYDPEFSDLATPLEEVLKHRSGVCQDFAHLAIGCLRSLGLAARYVSGYIETLPPPGKERLVGADASHAWFSVYLPGAGWIDFDPTNNQLPGEQHVTVAWGRDYGDVTPLKGVVYGGGDHELTVSVDVERLEGFSDG